MLIKVLSSAMALLSAAAALSVSAADLSGDEIARRAAAINGGHDATATLTFILQQPGAAERKLVYDMAWKHYDSGDVSLKTIFFSEFPPDDHGQAYMGWFYRPAAHRESDEWMYLPSLRSVRKLGHVRSPDEKEHDEFSKSVLGDAELMPRSPDEDSHKLLRHEQLDGRDTYVVEYVPRMVMGAGGGMDDMDMGADYSKSLRWIDRQTMLLRRIDYYDKSGAAVKRQLFTWKRIGDAWVWGKVEGIDLKTHNRTTLTVTDMHINRGINDRVFTKRTMRLGLDAAVR